MDNPNSEKWFDDDLVKSCLSNAVVALEKWRKLRYGRQFREVPLRSFSEGLVETLRQILSEDDDNKPIPKLLTDEELAFILQSSVLLLLFPTFTAPQQASLLRSIKKGTVQKNVLQK